MDRDYSRGQSRPPFAGARRLVKSVLQARSRLLVIDSNRPLCSRLKK